MVGVENAGMLKRGHGNDLWLTTGPFESIQGPRHSLVL